MRPPIIVLARDAPLFFQSVAEAEEYMEPVDVRGGEYRVYDASGQRLRLEIVLRRRPALFGVGAGEVEATRISGPDEQVATRDAISALSQALGEFLRRAGDATVTDDLETLIARCIKRFGYNA